VSGIHLNHYVPQVQVLMEKLQLEQLTTINTEGNYIDYNCINLQQLMQKVITIAGASADLGADKATVIAMETNKAGSRICENNPRPFLIM
jgi:hypothetical protein